MALQDSIDALKRKSGQGPLPSPPAWLAGWAATWRKTRRPLPGFEVLYQTAERARAARERMLNAPDLADQIMVAMRDAERLRASQGASSSSLFAEAGTGKPGLPRVRTPIVPSPRLPRPPPPIKR